MRICFRPSGRIIHETIDGEVIIVHLDTGVYYSLQDVGATTWSLFERGLDLELVAEAIERRYEGSPEAIRGALERFSGELGAEGLIERADPGTAAPVATTATGPSALRAPFTAPILEKHTDMQDLILLDPVHEVDGRGWPYATEAEAGRD